MAEEAKKIKSQYQSQYGSVEICRTAKLVTSQSQDKITVRKLVFAYVIAILSYVLSCASLVCVQVLGGAVPEFQLNAWRFGMQLMLVFPINIYRKCDLKVPRRKLPLIFAMFFLYNVFNITYYTGVIYVAVGTVFGIASTITIAANVVLSICIKKDRKIPLYVGATLALIGLIMMIQPEFMFPGDILHSAPKTNYTSPCVFETGIVEGLGNTDINKQWLGYIFAVISGAIVVGILHGMSNVVSEVSSFTFAFWNGLVGTTVSLILMGILETPVMPTSPMCVLLLLGHAIGTSQISVVTPWCLQYLSPTVCGLIYSLQLVLLLLMQYTVLKDIQPGNGNWVEILGAVVCFLGIIGGPTWHLYKESKSISTSIVHH